MCDTNDQGTTAIMGLFIVPTEDAERAQWALRKLGDGLGEGVTVIEADEVLEELFLEHAEHVRGECSDDTSLSPAIHDRYHLGRDLLSGS